MLQPGNRTAAAVPSGMVPVVGAPRAAAARLMQACSCSKGASLQLQLIGHAASEDWPWSAAAVPTPIYACVGSTSASLQLQQLGVPLPSAGPDADAAASQLGCSPLCAGSSIHSLCTGMQPLRHKVGTVDLGREVLICRLLRYGDPGPPIWPLSSLHGLLSCNCCDCAALLVHVCDC